MTAAPPSTRTTPSDLSPAPVRDHRAGPRLQALAVVAGGVLFAVGNLLHPLRHDEAAPQAATWVAAHVVFGIGAVLIAAGLGSVARRLAPSRIGSIGVGVTWLGMVLIPAGAVTEAWVRPLLGHHGFAAFEEAALGFTGLAGFSTLTGPVLMAAGALAHRLLPPVVAVALLGITVGGLLAPALPAEGYGIIPGTVLYGLGMAAAGWLSRPAT